MTIEPNRSSNEESTRHLVRDAPVGGGQSNPFTAVWADDDVVTKLELWAGDVPGSGQVIQGIQITYDSVFKSPMCGSTTSNKAHYNFAFYDGEVVEAMTISGGARCYSIAFWTNRNDFLVGGPGGELVDMECGNGVLLGFEGKSGSGIDALGAVFAKDWS